MPAAGYEPSGSETAQETKINYWEDPHAKITHNERRNPTTAFRQTQGRRGIMAQAGLDASDKRVRVLPDIVEGLESTNESVLSHRLNETFRILTAASVLLLPLTLIASIFGMNVDLPGDESLLEFWVIVIIMAAMLVALVAFFRNRGWL